ncbi:MAG: Asp-tRNA(Asn)/Glu-tRNA(Gln) amidotransferase subunit GatC [Bacilli bacterium]|nr:Asp-tRNA(Asn)/Glu-tRNA(Gln) amidotransferase subunit GatC [Bacilli bacterium]MDD4298361.1 Asp-tRNA(Asn)/Glu-tRNA(Gln) amidotransferase subunit GatC [Bacilli bacterium]MDD4644113.1 Asp-tRNA(Asn)/Glu-tRNA(Gln) amidotransferase subunit GatC [Bacilli bacterium]
MKSLTDEKIIEMANSSKIELTEEEMVSFKEEFKKLLSEMKEIEDLNITEENILISPTDNTNVYNQDEVTDMLSIDEALSNAPKTLGNYVEVVRVIND